MKNIYLLLLISLSNIEAYSQADTINIKTDSLPFPKMKIEAFHLPTENDTIKDSFFKEGAKRIVSSLFGESRKLNNADSIINRFDALPSFGIYKDNYIVVGTELSAKPTKYNSDAKFQVSIRHRLTNSTLPFKTHLFLTYTQKAFWGVFQDSFPFLDLNFNPSLGIGKALVYNNRYLGRITMQFEHESNGKDSLDSRSWNRLNFGANLVLNENWKIESNAWIPIIDGQNNRDIVKYAGWSSIGGSYYSTNKKFAASCVIVNRKGFIYDSNVILNFSARLFSDDEQFIFLEYYNGYGESLYDYKQYRQRIRLGIVIKPDFFHII